MDLMRIGKGIVLVAALALLFSSAGRSQTTAGGELPTYQASSSRRVLSTANPFAPQLKNGGSGFINGEPGQGGPGSGYPVCPHVCILVHGEDAGEVVRQFEEQHHCRLDSSSVHDPTKDQACTEKWREDESFLQTSEGALQTNGYVPVYKRDVVKNGKVVHKKGEVIGASGVTISTGVDLGQQSESGTRSLIDKYVKDKGNPDNVDVDALMKKLHPYFGLKKRKALDELNKTPLKVTNEEAGLLEKAFGYDTQTRVAKQFDAGNTKNMVFKKLPEEAQTVIVDFAYQYGLSDSKGPVRQMFWRYVYDADWQKLASWLKGKPDIYTNRRTREGDRLQYGIDGKNLPASGDPCA